MAIVFVHGNPETPAVWDLLADRLREAGHDDQVRLAPPGFGSPVPPAFAGTVRDYRDWLVAELERLDHPVDLVGHDWGGGLTVAVAMTRPDLLRSWCSDAIGIFDPDYVWHRLARIWQTPGAGEEWIATELARSPRERADERFTPLGVDSALGLSIAEGFDRRMADRILPLYRSAAQPVMAELGRDLEAARARPGLVVLAGGDDAVGTDEQRRRSAARAGARLTVLDGLGHWWMLQDRGARAAAGELNAFWSGL